MILALPRFSTCYGVIMHICSGSICCHRRSAKSRRIWAAPKHFGRKAYIPRRRASQRVTTMNPDEMVFRLIAATILVMVGLTRDGVRFYIYLRQRPRRLPVEILRESLENVRNTADDLMATTPMALLALACFGGIGVFIFAPEKIAWSSVALPDWARFVGAAVALSGALGEMWALLYLGRQYSGLLRVRRDHMLIRQGPYACVRHPMY